jgi:uncharacterized protein (UPF0548 family)
VEGRTPDWLTATKKKRKKLCRQMGSFSREFGVLVERFAVQRKDHCRIMLARIGIHNQPALLDRLNRLLSELGRVCRVLTLKEEPVGLG